MHGGVDGFGRIRKERDGNQNHTGLQLPNLLCVVVSGLDFVMSFSFNFSSFVGHTHAHTHTYTVGSDIAIIFNLVLQAYYIRLTVGHSFILAERNGRLNVALPLK